jgi:Na+/proline symporter
MILRDANKAKTARRIGAFWVVIGLICSVLIGTIGIVYLQYAPLQGTDVEKVFMNGLSGKFKAFLYI